MLFMMLFYAAVLIALAAYLFTHRKQNFLTLKTVPKSVGVSLTFYAVILGVFAIVALVSAFVDLTWLKLTALVGGALVVGLLGMSLPNYINRNF